MPYLTVKELRENAHKLKTDGSYEKGGTRFVGTTEPRLALKYFPKKDGKILECGPAFGSFTKYLKDNGYKNIYLLDFYEALSFVKKEDFPFHEIDFNKEAMPYADGFFAGVTAWGILEHMENPFHYLREVHRVLNPESGVFILALPNVFHIISRLMFLKKGIFPRWDAKKNHIFVLPRGVFENTVLRYFDLVETIYTKPSIQYLGLERFSKWLPANEWFGNYVIYILKWKSFKPHKIY